MLPLDGVGLPNGGNFLPFFFLLQKFRIRLVHVKTPETMSFILLAITNKPLNLPNHFSFNPSTDFASGLSAHLSATRCTYKHVVLKKRQDNADNA